MTTDLRPTLQADGTILWVERKGFGSIELKVGSKIASTAATIALTAGGPSNPIGIAATAVAGALILIDSLDKSEEKKNLAVQRGEYETANRELISQNFQLDSKISELNAGLTNLKNQISGAGLSGLGLCLINCAYNSEKDAFNAAKNTFTQLQWENEQKRSLINQLIGEFEELKLYLSDGLDYLTGQVKKHKVLVIGGLALTGIGLTWYFLSRKKNKK